jgi:hypothetical protein
MRQVRLDPDFGRIHAGREQPKGEDASRLQQDMALPPCHFAYNLLAKTNLSN